MGMEYLQYRTVQILSRSLPRGVLYRVSDRLLDAFRAGQPDLRKAVKSNLRRIFASRGECPSEQRLDRLVRLVYRGIGRNFADFFYFHRLEPSTVKRYFTVEGREHLDAALARGKGVLIVSAHFGSFELAGAVTAAVGYPVSIVALPKKDPRAERLFLAQRRRWGISVIPMGRAAGGSLAALHKGRIVALNGDYDFSTRDDRATGLGAPMRMSFGHARLALKTGAPVVPSFATRNRDGTYRVRFFAPIVPGRGSTVEEIHAAWVQVFEGVLRDHPHLWFVFSDMWDAAWSLQIARQGHMHLNLDAALRQAAGAGPQARDGG
jgi:lauroyl/myristoyl acyltransferase